MNATAIENYHTRFRKVLVYIDRHLDEELTLERLSEVAAFSKFHFHRQFSELYGCGVYRYVQLLRLKRASYQLAFRSQPVIEVALASGYEGPEAFARAFKRCLGQSPSAFRKQPQWDPWHAIFSPLSELRSQHMNDATPHRQVDIIHFNATHVAVLEHRGAPHQLGNSIRRFIEWRKQQRLHPSSSATFNIVYDDPAAVAPEAFRFDLCAATEREVTENDYGVVAKTIPAGRCAVLRHIGSDDTLEVSVRYLYAQWLPHSGEELRDFPLFFQRVKFYPDVAEHEAIIDVFLPLR